MSLSILSALISIKNTPTTRAANIMSLIELRGVFMRTTISAAVCLALASVAIADNADAAIRKHTSISAQSLEPALREFAKERDLQLIFVAEDLHGRNTKGAVGELTHTEALNELLNGTGLRFIEIDEQTISILPKTMALEEKRTTEVSTKGASQFQRTASASSLSLLGTKSVRLAQSAVEGSQASEAKGGAKEQSETNRAKVELEEVIVTGTNIRNVTDEFSPVISVDREFMDRAGYATVGEYIARLPQNFGGGRSATLDRGSDNVGASSVNLRGMGAGATLTLLNGRRMAPSSTAGNYVDISSIPTAALERVDVLTDGASAIYGSDAVAGVVNFILRNDYNGSETRARVDTKTEGDANAYQIGQTFGVSSERGRALLSYEYTSGESLDANDRNFTAMMDDPNDILPGSDRHGAFFSGALNLAAGIELFTDLNYSDRRSQQHRSFNGFNQRTIADVENWGAAVGLTLPLGADWRAEVSAATSVNDFRNVSYELPTSIGSGGYDMWSDDSVWSVEAKADGGLFDLWGGTMRAVIGAQYREESHDGASDFFDEFGEYLNFVQLEADVARQVSALYAEVYAPLVSEKNEVPGVRSLALSLAGRYENYSDFGTAFNPKFGVLWSPFEGVTLRGSLGRSFRAPPLYQMVDKIETVAIVDYVDPEVPSGRSVAALVAGESSDLDAETSTSWSFGIDLQPALAPQFSARLTYYDIEYKGRIATPSGVWDTNTWEYRSFPLPLNRNPDLNLIQHWIDMAMSTLNLTQLPNGSQSDLPDVTVLLWGLNTNTAVSRAKGVDADISYDFSIRDSRWVASMNANYILESQDQFSRLRAPVKMYDRIFEPAALRMRGSLTWSLNAVSANLFADYVSSYSDDRVQDRTSEVGSWLTFDASLQYDFDRAGATGLLSGAKATLSVRNILNNEPPRVAAGIDGTEPTYAAYDSANADPDGRTIALQISKKW